LDLCEIIDKFRGPLIGLIASWGATYNDTTEIAQDSFADAYLNRESCRENWEDPEVVAAWLRGFARNKFRNERRSRKRREKLVVSVPPAVLEVSLGQEPAPVDPRLERLRDAIDNLPFKLKQGVMMHYLEATSVKDVAALLSVSPKAIEGRLYQARRQLKQIMGTQPVSVIAKALLL
jgi:RNA polymerase sigma factor (sigma-70 family)